MQNNMIALLRRVGVALLREGLAKLDERGSEAVVRAVKDLPQVHAVQLV